jgi:Nif-specific regulatory protein
MAQFSTLLLEAKKLGAIRFDRAFKIRHVTPQTGKLLGSAVDMAAGDDFILYFQEFVGSEAALSKLIDSGKGCLHLKDVNRDDEQGGLRYFDFLVLPDPPAGDAVLVVEEVTERARLQQELNQQRYDLHLLQHRLKAKKRSLSDKLMGNSPAIERVRDMVAKLSRVPSATVLLLGPSGTGKSLTAAVLHAASFPGEAPFVDVNCAALPETLIEAELFGHEKGAFTHAVVSRPGLFQAAAGGTIFLNEIGELPLSLQTKLLSVIESKQFRRLGSNKLVDVQARIVAATNKDLTAEVGEKRFREDLFHRLNVVSITLPSLREMGKDVITIAEHFLTFFNVEFNKRVKGFTPAARDALLAHDWPGNVRELSNCIERAMIFSEGDRLDTADFVLQPPLNAIRSDRRWSLPPEGITLEAVERQLILSALEQAGGNKTRAAGLLGLSRDTLRYRLDKYSIEAAADRRRSKP